MAIHVVTIVRHGADDRTVAVRVTAAALAAECEERVLHGGRRVDADAVRDDMARQAAVRRVWGRSVRWQSSGIAAHRGQVWTPCRTGGESAVTGEITIRVDA